MTNPDDTSPDTSPDTSDAPDDDAPRFSQADVNRIVTDRLARANRAATTTRTAPRSSGGSLAPADAVRRALAFSAAGYSPEECETFAASSEYALPPPPPASARMTPRPAASTTAPTIANPHANGALVDVSRMTAAELSALGPQGVAKAIAAVMESGRARDGRPQVPSSASLKRTR